ncbi:Anthranilate synthase subunit I [Sinomonas atrocyanea]|uniref:Anthranilate synthase component 1 n=1 Tax=Sinomonas atrocyanea TaxID=37927 RepID=A0A127A1V0_9MICC|nr:anthranilate synthase component I [Sinomonas atrocyanea]AMM32595.1 Anthranilate synthase subunit I [Sinomonas atrocyanea]GEB62632.1 anthranilate synthase component I [Sinomonas atrocyanea]GGG76173.1 anthranilate synthase component I [Sinomonas atrocyanea]
MNDLGVISPTLEEFRAVAAHRRVVPVHLRVLADAETPISLYRKLAAGRPGTFLLESASVGGSWSRYSFIGAASRATLTSRGGQAHWIGEPPVGVPTTGNPLEALRETVAALQTERFEGLPPLTSGMVGFVGWEAVRRWERLVSPPEDDLDLPELAMNLVTDLVAHDNVDGTLTIVANAINFDNSDERVDEAWHDAVARLRRMLAALAEPAAPALSILGPNGDYQDKVIHQWAEQGYLDAIERGKRAIYDGEVFQVVISRRFELECDADPLDVYRVLRATNPSPYMYLLSLEDAEGREYSIVGSSPEALVTVTGEQVVTHPIAGSRPRGATVEADKALAEELLADEKERAEHLMLVDLARNDLSKVCRPGTVEVSEFMEVERFSHIMHLVSTVDGKLRPDASAYDVLAATFPAGTLSGAPKPRALRLLDEVEPVRRGVYGGVVGYFDFAGDLDMAIAIRTALLRGGRAYVQSGGGIVADSDPAAEAQESVNKAAAPLRAVHTASALRPAQTAAGVPDARQASAAAAQAGAARG